MADHPIAPSPELVQQWDSKAVAAKIPGQLYIATQAARWGADQELEASEAWIRTNLKGQLRPANRIADDLRAGRRPPVVPETIEVDGHTYRLIK